MASVKVAVRVRPLNKREEALGSSMVVRVHGNVIQLTNNKASELPHDIFTSRDKSKQFTFDHSYWSVDSSHENYASQDKIFHDLGIGVVESAFSGYNACIFAYGQTGSGKTHTMMGSESNPGLTPRICEGIFANMDKPDLTYRTEVSYCEIIEQESYLEIYNERVRDLLRDGVQATNLKVREHAKDGPYVQDLSRRVVTSYREIGEILRKGNVNRTTASTGMNEHSSRSHAIFTIYFSQARISGDLPSEINSKIHLVDLAGSERADSAGTTGERLREGGSINKSLVILGNVISALAEMNDSFTNVTSSSSLLSTTSSSSSSSSRRFIPYRNSVLTWLLKDSLGGNSRTVMVATISPADCCYAETLGTLRYAKRAKKIVNMPSVNEDGNVRLIRELRAENAKLKRMLADAMMQEGLTPPREVEETREKLSKNEEKMQELMEAWTDKWKEVINVLKEHEMLALRKEGSGVLLDSGLPYLLCIDDSVLSTGMKLYHIKEGDTIVGRDNPIHRPDIVLSGRFIENIHCIVRFENSNCFLIPGENAMCCIDSIQVVEPTKLTQGSMIQLGRNHFFRFNDPVEAAKLREEMNEGYDRGNMSHIWKDIQRAWSTFSMTDSAIDSDVSMVKNDARFKDWLDSGVQETKKNNENDIPKDGEQNDLEDNKCNFLVDAQLKIKILNEEIENELKSVDKSESELEPMKGISEEYDILRMEKERQEEEWCELEKQKHHQHSLRLDDQIILSRRQEHMEKLREVEKKIWSGEIEEMRALMDEEVQQLCDAPLNCIARTPDNLSTSDDSNFNSMRRAPLSCRGTSFDRCPVSANHRGTFECTSLDGYNSRKEFPIIRSTTPLRSIASGGTFEDLLPSDIETFKLMSSIDDKMDDLDGPMGLPMDLAEESFSNSFSLSLEDDISMPTVGTYISNMYKIIKSIYFDEFSKSSRFLKHETKHLHFAQQINEKLLTITKLISRSEKLSPEGFKSKSCDGKIELLENLLNLYESISIMNQQQCNSMFSEAAQTLLKIVQIASSTKQLIDEEIGDDEMKTLIQTEVCLRREMFLYEMSENWDELIKWNKKKSHSNKESCSKTSLDLKLAVNNRKKMKGVCEAMHLCGGLDEKLRTFSKNFATHLMEPGIKGYFVPHCEETPCLIQVFNSADSSLAHQKMKEELDDDYSPDSSTAMSSQDESTKPEAIIARIEQSLRLLWCAFSFSIETDPSYSLTAIIGKNVYEDIIRSLCQHCLVPYFKTLDFENVENQRQQERYQVPDCKSWKHLNDILLKVQDLQKQIVQFGFITSSSSSSFRQILPTIKGHAFKRHKQFIDCALKIGISTLGVSVNVSPDHPIGVHLGEDVLRGDESKDGRGDEGEKWSVERFIVESIHSSGALKMPFCSVSLPCCDIVKLSYTLLHESQSCCVLVASLLQPCLEDITQHFLNLITNHQLPKNPTFDALLHNSCLFMAQHLMIIERSFSRMLSSLPVEFMEEAFANEKNLRTIRDRLKNVAETHFSDSVLRQRKVVKQLLPSSAGFACAADDEGRELKNNIKTILDNIQEISNSWSNILSSSLYFRSIGTLIEELVMFIVESILSILEFSEEDCMVLREVMEDVMNVTPNYFITSLSSKATNVQVVITENVPSWLRMIELHRLLNSFLADIRDRWASGLGPLSVHFTGDQVVSLVRAIFETTQNREAVIKEILSNPSVHK